MTKRWITSPVVVLVAFGLATVAESAVVSPAGEQLEADTSRTTSAGTTFTAPAGWSIETRANMVLLTPPEADSHIALVDVKADDADSAVAAAWAAYQPDFERPLEIALPQAALNGWEERRYYEYETSPNERLSIYAFAWRAGTSWIGIIVDASEPTLEKRSAPISLVLESLKPKGYQRETFAGKKAHALDADRIAVMKDFVASGMKQLGIPGVGFSLIDRGEVVFEGGLGVKELGKAARVDARTLFLAASNTKALTTLLLAQLVDEKKLRWDQPVTDVFPGFELGDAATTRQVLIKHLICACTGLPRQDLEWIFEFREATPASSFELLATMQPTSDFGEVFQYSNLMAAAAGYVAAAVLAPKLELGAAYDNAMQSRIFRPLGMQDTTFDFARAEQGNHARPHGHDINGQPSRAPMDLNYSVVPVRPAGGVWTSAHDLSKYVQMELARGALPNGKQLVSEENLLARRKSQVMLGEDVSYGMGLSVDTHWGIPVVQHGGALIGYLSDMMWFPDHGVGAVVLTNSESGGALLAPFLRRLVEVLFDARPEAEQQLSVAAAQQREDLAKEREQLVIPADPQQVDTLAARYSSPALGELTVKHKGGRTVFDVGEWRSAMASRKNDDGTMSFITIDPTLRGFDFVVGEHNGKRTLIVRDAQHEYKFTEVALP